MNLDTSHEITLSSVESNCWQMLSVAVSNRKDPMRTMVVGSVAGTMAQIRTVVLRKVEINEKNIYFHTDIRSSKIEDIRRTGQLSWLAYDQAQRTQIRLCGTTTLHHGDDVAQTQWNLTPHHSRRNYLLPEGSGKKHSEDFKTHQDKLSDFSYTLEESEAGFKNFVVVITNVEKLDWYYAHHTGNRRAGFTYENGLLKYADWLTP
jgi:pyridoxine/pyridoxamine 5'-phosphate oxidase